MVQKNEKPRTEVKTVKLKHLAVSLNADRGFALINLDDESREAMEPAGIDLEEQDGVVLINTSKYLRMAISGEEIDEIASGKGWANVKLRVADYDWTYKKKTGHTRKWELLGVNFLTWSAYDPLSDLNDDDSDVDDLGDLPF